MVNLGTARLAGVIVVISLVAVVGTNSAFAQTPCGAVAYAYVGCMSLDSAQVYGAAITAGVIAFAIGCGAAFPPRFAH